MVSWLYKHISKKQNHGSTWHQIRVSRRKKRKNNLEAIKKLMLLTYIWRTCFVWLKLNKALKIRNISPVASRVPIACFLYCNSHFLCAKTSYWKLPSLFPMVWNTSKAVDFWTFSVKYCHSPEPNLFFIASQLSNADIKSCVGFCTSFISELIIILLL